MLATTIAADEPVSATEAAASLTLDDTAVFEALYRRYAGPIHAYCYQRLGTTELAEDATSQVFHNAYRSRSGFRGGSVGAWLYRIADNAIIDIYRAQRPAEPLDRVLEAADPHAGPEEEALSRDRYQRVQTALQQLSPERRRVVELRLSGLTGPEIAALLGQSPEWVRTAQHRAIAQLQTLLDIPEREDETDER